jgi:hypothetical protein
LTCVIVGMIANPFSIFLFRFSTWLALVVKCFSFVLHVHRTLLTCGFLLRHTYVEDFERSRLVGPGPVESGERSG